MRDLFTQITSYKIILHDITYTKLLKVYTFFPHFKKNLVRNYDLDAAKILM